MCLCVLLQKVLLELQVENQQRLKDREQELKDLKKVMEVMKVGQQKFSSHASVASKGNQRFPSNADSLVTLPLQHSEDRLRGDTEVELSELQRSVERLQELLEEVLDQAGMEKMGQAQEVADSLVAEIKLLKKRDTEMKDLARCEDNIHYLQVGWTSELSREGLTKGMLGYASGSDSHCASASAALILTLYSTARPYDKATPNKWKDDVYLQIFISDLQCRASMKQGS